MFERVKKFTLDHPKLKKAVGYFLVVVGFLALVTPLTPGGFLFIIGLELLGLRLAFLDRFMPRKFQRKREVVVSPEVVS